MKIHEVVEFTKQKCFKVFSDEVTVSRWFVELERRREMEQQQQQSNLYLEHFHGKSEENGEHWLERFSYLARYKGLTEPKQFSNLYEGTSLLLVFQSVSRNKKQSGFIESNMD